MPIECGHRLAASFPNSRFVQIADSGTLIPLDQPQLLARAISAFVLRWPPRLLPLMAQGMEDEAARLQPPGRGGPIDVDG